MYEYVSSANYNGTSVKFTFMINFGASIGFIRHSYTQISLYIIGIVPSPKYYYIAKIHENSRITLITNYDTNYIIAKLNETATGIMHITLIHNPIKSSNHTRILAETY